MLLNHLFYLETDFKGFYFVLFFYFAANLNEKIVAAKEVQQQSNAKIKDIQANLADAEGYRERQLKEATDNMNRLKKQSEKSQKEWKKREQDAETLNLEIDDLRKSIAKSKEDVVEIEENIAALQQKVGYI